MTEAAHWTRASERRVGPRQEEPDGARRHFPGDQAAAVEASQVMARLSDALVELGFLVLGSAPAAPFLAEASALGRFLAEGRAGEMQYLGELAPGGRLARQDPAATLSGAKTALIVALPYSPPGTLLRAGADGPILRGEVAAYAGGRDYHHVIKERLLIAADVLADLSGAEVRARACVDTAPIFERQFAERTGSVFLGKNTLAIAPGSGSYFHLGVLLLSREADLPKTVRSASTSGGCGSCTQCISACPTGALNDQGQMDARLCISYLTIEKRGPIPAALRAPIKMRIFGCDACQTSCPYNQTTKLPAADPELLRFPLWQGADLVQLLNLSSAGYRKWVKKTAARRTSREQLGRNAAIALGNSGQVEALEPLLACLKTHHSPLVQGHAAWALGELGVALPEVRDEAILGLETALSHPDPEVQSEARDALDRLKSLEH